MIYKLYKSSISNKKLLKELLLIIKRSNKKLLKELLVAIKRSIKKLLKELIVFIITLNLIR